VPPVRTPALVLRKFEYGETSQVLHLLTRDHGRVHALAKGSMKERGAFGGPIDVLDEGDARFYPRRDGLAVLGSFDRGPGFPGIRKDLSRLEAAFAVLEVLAEASREDHADPGLFDLGVGTLRALAACPPDRTPAALLRFDLRALAALGVGPVFDACAICGTPLAKAGSPALSAARGGMLCSAHRGADAFAVGATRGVLAALSLLGGPDEAAASRLALGPRDLRSARRLGDALLRHALEAEIGRAGKGRRRVRRPASKGA
jgi:DNA repair protein RecO (recombination protein O)